MLIQLKFTKNDSHHGLIMAIPPLEHQIKFVDTILVLRVSVTNEIKKYTIEEVLKSKYAKLNTGEFIPTDFSIFELLGYRIRIDQQVVVFLALKKNLTDFDCIDFLPVENGAFDYGKDDPSVYRHLSIAEFKVMIKEDKG
jgi:hypothetical protein